MKRFSAKVRKVLRKIYLILGVSAVSLTIMACYGMPTGDYNVPEDEPPPVEEPTVTENSTIR